MRTWIFQGNPDDFDLDAYLATTPVRFPWLVTRYGDEISVGDRVYIWRTQGKQKGTGGIIAEAVVIAPVAVLPESADAIPFWRANASVATEARPRAGLRLLHVATRRELIRRDWCAEDPVLQTLPNLIRGVGVRCDLTLIAFRHGLRVSETVDLRWDQVDFNRAVLHIRRTKQGTPSVHPILGEELRVLRRLQREQAPKSPFVFTSERGAPFTTAGFARMVERVGVAGGLGLKVHPHMLRHACGFALANKGHDTRALQAYLGHRNIQHTVRYTELAPERFKDFWR